MGYARQIRVDAIQMARATQGMRFRRLYSLIRTLLRQVLLRASVIEVARLQTGESAAMYMFRPISVYLACILSILVMCGFLAVVQAEELPEILRGPTTPPAVPPPKPAVERCGNLTYGYAKDYQCCCTHWNGYNYRYCVYSKPRNSDGSLQGCSSVCRNSFPCI